jgi:hypothetical protein
MGVFAQTKHLDFFGTACGTIIFAEATGTTISCILGRWYGPLFSLSFLNVYAGKTKWGSITVPLTSCLTDSELAV